MKKYLNSKITSDFGKKIFKGTFLLAFGSIFSRMMLSISFVVLARILTTTEYGEYGMLKSTIDNFLIFASMGIGLTTTKYISELKDIDKKAASSILGTALGCVLALGIILSILLSFFSDYISIHVLKQENLKQALVISSFVLVFTAFNATQLGALLGLQSYKTISTANIVQGVSVFLGLCIGGYYGRVSGVIIGNLVALIITSLVIQYLLRLECKKIDLTISVRNWKEKIKLIYKFAIPASLSTLITAPTIWILNTMLIRQQNGYYELGIYSAVIIFSTAIQMLNGSISNVLLPIFLAKDVDITPKKEFFNYFGAWYISIILAIPLMLFPELITFILGGKYTIGATQSVLYASIISTLLIAHRQGVGRDLIIKNKMWLSVFSMGQWAVTTFIAFYFLRAYGAIGFAGSFCIGYVINTLIFIPLYIYLKISTPALFYNLYVWSVWILIAAIAVFNIIESRLIIRIPISLILVVILLGTLRKLYEKYIQKNI